MKNTLLKNGSIVLSVLLALMVLLAPQAVTADEDGDVAPAPPSIGADIPLTYFGPAPSDVQRELIGPYQLLKSGKMDLDAGTIKLPLYRGVMGRSDVWYVVTDTTDKFNAEGLGINHSPKLNYASIGKAVRTATLIKDEKNNPVLEFKSGKVDFSPKREVVPGKAPNFFPPQKAKPGSVGDKDYSPLVRVVNAGGHIYNAPVVAFGVKAEKLNIFCEGKPDHSIVHDKVVAICPREGTVTLELTAGFSFARPVLYVSTEGSDPVVATLEGATYTPALADVPTGGDDSLFSAVERIFVAVNGPTGKDNPQRQGLNSALSDGRTPLNVLGGIPTIATDYSPLWDLNPFVWTKEAVRKGYRSRLTEEFDILGKVENGHLVGPGGEFGSIGVVVNCPIVFRFL
ncbi:hypothetical protein [Candidatus Mycalebacterium sp.]